MTDRVPKIGFFSGIQKAESAKLMMGIHQSVETAIGEHLEIIQFLADYTENPNAPGEGGITPPLYWAARWGHVKVVKFFG